MKSLYSFLSLMTERGASDMFLSAGSPPYLKIDGATRVVATDGLSGAEIRALADELMSADQRSRFAQKRELNFSFSAREIGRFRLNVYFQRGEIAIAVRHIQSVIPDMDALGLPVECAELAMVRRGLILIVGAASSGKSTTLASMISYRASHADDHILTIEDPIEFVFAHQRSLVEQREVGVDTLSFDDALKNALREAPDVIVIGEIRDMETAHHAIACAESGHLCISTMHAANATQAIERILNYFPDAAHKQVLLDLSLHLEAVISQRLVTGRDGKRMLAPELLKKSGYICELIRQGRLAEIKHALELGNQTGVVTLDQSLFRLYQAGKISRMQALDNADSHADLALMIRLSEQHSARDAPALTLAEPNLDGSYD